MFDYTREHENDFSFWYPKIKDCGIPTPLTFYTKLPSAEEEPEYAKRLYEAFYMEHPKEDEEVVKAYLEERVIPKLKEMGLTGHVFVKNAASATSSMRMGRATCTVCMSCTGRSS